MELSLCQHHFYQVNILRSSIILIGEFKQITTASALDGKNSRIFLRTRKTVKAFWNECKNSEEEWGETLRACEARALHKQVSRLRRFAPSENVRKRLFCGLLVLLRAKRTGDSTSRWSAKSLAKRNTKVKETSAK